MPGHDRTLGDDGTPADDQAATDVAAIRAVTEAMYGSFTAGDVAGIDACLHERATVWDVFTPELVVGRAQRDAFHARDRAQMRARGPLALHVSEPLVDVHGDVAWARYLVDFRYDPPGAMAGQVRVTDVLLRGPDGWRVVHHHEGLTPT